MGARNCGKVKKMRSKGTRKKNHHQSVREIMYKRERCGNGILNSLSTTTTIGSLLTAGMLTDRKVHNHKNEILGDVIELMLDIHTGAISYAILSIRSRFGLGEKLLAVPWKALTIDTEKQHLTLATEKDHLKNAPGFHKNDWPNMTNPHWTKQIHLHYGIRPS